MLLPTFHQRYWLGLAAVSWPDFRWLDGLPGPAAQNLSATSSGVSSYGHWAELALEWWEPDEPLQLCATASFAHSYNGSWGWTDEQCDEAALPFMCKLIGAPAPAWCCSSVLIWPWLTCFINIKCPAPWCISVLTPGG